MQSTMSPVPDCLQRRYQAMDTLVTDLTSPSSSNNFSGRLNDRSIELMCNFWNILKADPECDLQNAVQEKMALHTQPTGIYATQDITCYQVGNDEDSLDLNPSPKPKTSPNPQANPKIKCGKEGCAKSQDPSSSAYGSTCCSGKEARAKCCGKKGEAEEVTPLSIALGNMQAADQSGKRCCEKTAELMTVQEQLKVQVAWLEQREQAEVKLLKEAEKVWSEMEAEYKMKLEDSKNNQERLLQQLKRFEESACKWKKNKQSFEEQTRTVDKYLEELKIKYKKKVNDLKTIEAETNNLQKRIDSNKKEIEKASSVLKGLEQTYQRKMDALAEETKKLEAAKSDEESTKKVRTDQGNEYVKEAREELVKLCRVLLKKKLETEDLRAECKAVMDEIDLLKITCGQCGEKCKNKEGYLKSEIEKCKKQIENFKLRCTKCHVSCDTITLRKYCSDCPRCLEEIDPCVSGPGKCSERAMNDCVCVRIKNKFMNNVFDNMYTVLTKQINTRAGKNVAAQVLQCLQQSTNGKLDPPIRTKLQEFILATVKTNLNLTIIGGAVKTRCEMDPDTYKEFQKCVLKVPTIKPVKIDKGTDSRKAPCGVWGGPGECNCPKGPKGCICSRKAPKPSSDKEPCPQLAEDKEDIGKLSICPSKDKTPCGPLCENVKTSDTAVKLAKTWNPQTCKGEKCTFSKNVRAAQCALGQDYIMKKRTNRHKDNAPIVVVPSDDDTDQVLCGCNEEFSSNYDGNTKTNTEKRIQEQKTGTDSKLLPVTVVGQNGLKANIEGELTTTPSGHLAMNVKRLSDVGEISSSLKEYPVLFHKTSSSYKLVFLENNKEHNAILRSDSTGEMNVVFKHPQDSNTNKTGIKKTTEKLFDVRLKNVEACPHVTFLRRTSSGNLEIVLEKEFEKQHKEIVLVYLGDITECSANLYKTKSGTYVVDFEEDCNCHVKEHNILVRKSESGHIKLIVKYPNLNPLKTQKYSSIKCRNRFENLYKKLRSFSTQIRKQTPKQKDIEINLECGLKLDGTIKIKIHDQTHFIAEVLVTLKKRCHGQYYVFFEKESEALFVINLLTSWIGLLPVKKATERELVAFLVRGKEVQNRYGWLKLCSDGKVLMVVDKIAEDIQTDPVYCGTREKASTTTCNSRANRRDCDISICSCGNLP